MSQKIDFNKFAKRERVNFINSLSGFKSANLIGTINSSGLSNLAIVSSVFHIGADPALIGFIIRPDSVPRHTLINIRDTKKCTINHCGVGMTEAAHRTSARFDANTSEFTKTNLTEEYIDSYIVPFVKESPIKFSASLIEEVVIKHNGTHLLIMKIDKVYLCDRKLIQEDYAIDLEGAGIACISGLNSYHQTELINKYPYAKVDI
jgi:flavin reductase (DIM6/NTAB) family NADH-FMN oxidoreductase RutF